MHSAAMRIIKAAPMKIHHSQREPNFQLDVRPHHQRSASFEAKEEEKKVAKLSPRPVYAAAPCPSSGTKSKQATVLPSKLGLPGTAPIKPKPVVLFNANQAAASSSPASRSISNSGNLMQQKHHRRTGSNCSSGSRSSEASTTRSACVPPAIVARGRAGGAHSLERLQRYVDSRQPTGRHYTTPVTTHALKAKPRPSAIVQPPRPRTSAGRLQVNNHTSGCRTAASSSTNPTISSSSPTGYINVHYPRAGPATGPARWEPHHTQQTAASPAGQLQVVGLTPDHYAGNEVKQVTQSQTQHGMSSQPTLQATEVSTNGQAPPEPTTNASIDGQQAGRVAWLRNMIAGTFSGASNDGR